ncbi:MAG: hypothetical protein ACWA42_01740 [Lutibacter sp.]
MTANILYDHLNLPTQVTFGNGNITYIYDATGVKLEKVVTEGTNITKTKYDGNYVYKKINNNPEELQFFNTPEGYVEPTISNGVVTQWNYVYQYTDIWKNVRLTYADADGNGTVAQGEIRRERNYYPFGLEHKGYNNTFVGAQSDFKTYQSQEFTEDLGLNTHEWKYRISDPALGHFWQIDPLADKYVYNSTYAFQENKMGIGTELEGKELMEFLNGIKKILQGGQYLATNQTYGKANRQMAIAKTSSSKKVEQIQKGGQLSTIKAVNKITSGGVEAIGSGGTILENTGDIITVAGIVTFQPEVVAVGE